MTEDLHMQNYFTEQTDFYKGTNPDRLLKEFGSPLYVYNEAILRDRCHDMASLISYPFLNPTIPSKPIQTWRF
jgi:hypothetical protein